jgi:hypothetical protein
MFNGYVAEEFLVARAADLADEPARERRRHGDTFLVGHRGQGALDQATEVQRDPVRRIGGAQRFLRGLPAILEAVQSRAERASVISSSYRPRGWSGVVGGMP